MSPTTAKLLIIDGNALLHRAWHALPQTMKAPDGATTNAAYGFMMFFFKALKDLHPTHIAVCFDAPGKTFRDELYAQYKATRVKKPQEFYDQIPIIQEFLKAFNVCFFQVSGVEADDVIGTLARKAEKQGYETIIATGDLDALQLVDEHTKVYTLSKGIADTVVYDSDAVRRRYGGLVPDRIVDFKALCGDQSDNIPGAEGIGEKTAIELLRRFGSVGELYQALCGKTPDEFSARYKLPAHVFKKLVESKKAVILSKKLATIRENVRLDASFDDLSFQSFSIETAVAVFHKYAFRRILPQIEQLGRAYGVSGKKENSAHKRTHYIFAKTAADVDALLKELSGVSEIAIDTETNSLDVMSLTLVGVSVSWRAKEGYYVEARHIAKLKPMLEDASIRKIGHNIKFDWHALRSHGIELHGIFFDTMVAAYVLNPGGRNYGLDALAFQHFAVSMQKIEDLIGKKGAQGQLQMDAVDPEKVALYSAEDACLTFALYELLWREIKAKKMERVFYEIEMPLVQILGEMERAGICLDVAHLKKLGSRATKSLCALEHSIYQFAGMEFNIGSSKQLTEVLFDKLHLATKGIKKTKTGISTAASELEKMRASHPIIEHIFEYRELSKLKSTYIDVLPKLVYKDTGRIHTSFNQVITATGRLSSSDPNMQNIPIRSELGREIRGAFVAAPGFMLVSLDYSQIDLRVVAHLSKDEHMIKTFVENKDIHTITAAGLFSKDETEVTKDERRRAKEANFGVLYGLGARGLAERLKISYEEAEDFISRYRALYPRVFLFLDAVIAETHKTGYAETLYGRRRYLPEINSSSSVVRAAAERAAINMPVQGTAADIIKKAMININLRIKTQNHQAQNKEEIKMLLQVHDELVFEMKEERVEQWAKVIKYEMENAAKLRVPLKVDAKAGRNWKEMGEI